MVMVIVMVIVMVVSTVITLSRRKKLSTMIVKLLVMKIGMTMTYSY